MQQVLNRGLRPGIAGHARAAAGGRAEQCFFGLQPWLGARHIQYSRAFKHLRFVTWGLLGVVVMALAGMCLATDGATAAVDEVTSSLGPLALFVAAL